MNKQLILKAAEAVIEFNKSQNEHSAGIQVQTFGTWVYIMDSQCKFVESTHSATQEQLEQFITKLQELSA